jgi:hypothetical protein
MEVYHCLNDIITTIEKESEVIGKAIFAYGSFAFIDFKVQMYLKCYLILQMIRHIIKFPCR